MDDITNKIRMTGTFRQAFGDDSDSITAKIFALTLSFVLSISNGNISRARNILSVQAAVLRELESNEKSGGNELC